MLFVIFATSFIFGSGAVFVLTWNASIIGVFLSGALAQQRLLSTIWDILVHAIPEILSFFLAAIAGGIVSVSMLRRSYTDKRSMLIYRDASLFLITSIVLLFVAAVLEVYF